MLHLPRELRDMILMALITWERPRPDLEDSITSPNYYGSHEENQFGCSFFQDELSSTCANVLAVNRQLNYEMAQAIERARKEGVLVARMDCMVADSNHYFTWLSIPIVHNTFSTPRRRTLSGWAPNVPKIAKLLASPQHEQQTTRIEQLQIDIRLFTDEFDRSGQPPVSYEPSPSWAVCAALRKVCEHRGDVLSKSHLPPSVIIDTLVLNVIKAYRGSGEAATQTESTSAGASGGSAQNMEYARVVANELVDVWTKLWSCLESKGRMYSMLLGRIQRVRVCMEGVVIRERALRLELDRGQEERRRIARRVGW
ncbi:hypothetical protein IQ06DRAFT_105566 [Phaeosphaeriaceae sp. SRC1lsM3a]|nr:hypothetical protein IQ06DRAFT_105566 [Stagonospora sp. SRC1lsM3a]